MRDRIIGRQLWILTCKSVGHPPSALLFVKNFRPSYKSMYLALSFQQFQHRKEI